MRESVSSKAFISLWAPVILYAVLIYLLSSHSFHFPWFQNAQKNHADKLAHVVEYSVFGALLCRALGAQDRWRRSALRLFLAVVAAGVLYGISDEFHQSFVPERDSSPYDVAADGVGVSLGACVWLMIRKAPKKDA